MHYAFLNVFTESFTDSRDFAHIGGSYDFFTFHVTAQLPIKSMQTASAFFSVDTEF